MTCFFRLNKVGCTVIENFFFTLHDNDKTVLEETLKNRHNGSWIHKNDDLKNTRIKLLREMSIDEQNELVKTMPKMVFVRDPLDRVISAWRDRFGSIEDVASVEIKQRYYVNFCFCSPIND